MISFLKKLFCLLYLSHFLGVNGACQNLVPNPSFEDTVSCPTTANQLDKAKYWRVSKGSPDYFNECDWVTGNVAVPNNFCGYQFAKDGVAYCGFVAFGINGLNTREYFTCQLISPLIIGKKYNVSFYVSLAGGIGKQVPCNKLGLLFSTIDYNLISNAPINNYAQFYSDSIISDTLNWILLEGSFIADSSYSYMSIGNFFDDFNTDTIYSIPSSYSYYFIDSIEVIEDSTTTINEFQYNIELTISPNPVYDYLNILSNKSLKNFKIELINLKGKLLFEFKNNSDSNQLKLNFRYLNPGLYALKIYFNTSHISNYIIVKL